jgi:hypothetical protein
MTTRAFERYFHESLYCSKDAGAWPWQIEQCLAADDEEFHEDELVLGGCDDVLELSTIAFPPSG